MSKFIYIFMLALFLGCASKPCCANEVGFLKPENKEALDYLGLKAGAGTFSLAEIKTDILVVEVFSMDCPICQGQASHVNELYELVAQKGFSGKIKMVGIGITNSDLGVRIYQKKFNVPFPLVADPDALIYRVTGRVEIPALCIFKRDAKGKMQMVYSKSREGKNAEAMLDKIILVTGLK